eukprot:2312357-Pyramimonas_sp.AAC.1
MREVGVEWGGVAWILRAPASLSGARGPSQASPIQNQLSRAGPAPGLGHMGPGAARCRLAYPRRLDAGRSRTEKNHGQERSRRATSDSGWE